MDLFLIWLLVIIPVFFGIKGKSKEMLMSIVAISLAFCFHNIDKFTKIKAGVVEADLKTVVNEAYAAISQVRKLALVLSEPIDSSLAVEGFMQYLPLEYKLEEMNHIKSALAELGIPEKDIKERLNELITRVRAEHIKRIIFKLNEVLPDNEKLYSNLDEVNMDEWNTIKIHSFIKENNIKEEGDLKEAIIDLEYFEKNQKLRRKDIWQG